MSWSILRLIQRTVSSAILFGRITAYCWRAGKSDRTAVFAVLGAASSNNESYWPSSMQQVLLSLTTESMKRDGYIAADSIFDGYVCLIRKLPLTLRETAALFRLVLMTLQNATGWQAKTLALICSLEAESIPSTFPVTG